MKIVKSVSDALFDRNIISYKSLKVPKPLPFTFYYSEDNGRDNILVWVKFRDIFGPRGYNGVLHLCGDWDYTPDPDDIDVPQEEVDEMINFFKTYKVLFAAVWEQILQVELLYDYFCGYEDFDTIIKALKVNRKFKKQLSNIHTVDELESVVREYNIFNLND